MSEIADFIKSKPQIEGIYEILTVSNPKIEEEYGTISIVKVQLDNKQNKPLLIVPGWSVNSFKSAFDIVLQVLDHIKPKYSVMYFLCWGSTVKKLTVDISKDIKDETEAFKQNEILRIKLAHVLDKILRSPDMNLTNITVFAKSAGAGACIHIASWNPEIKYLFLSCPGTNSLGTPLANRKGLTIKLAWNVIIIFIPC